MSEGATGDLETMIEDLQRYGRPRVMMIDGGWHAAIEVNTSVPGASGTIRSEFDHQTPRAAVKECLERAVAALGAGKSRARFAIEG